MNYQTSHLFNWLKNHPAIKISVIEETLNIPKRTLYHFLKERRHLPPAYKEQVEDFLLNYGYVPLASE